jgi:hypothetical protein
LEISYPIFSKTLTLWVKFDTILANLHPKPTRGGGH